MFGDHDERQVAITLTLREWQSVFGALGDTAKEQSARRKALWSGGTDYTYTAVVARHKVREQLRKEVEL